MRALLFLLSLAAFAQSPQYESQAVLKSPKDYRNWYFVGASLGISYSPTPSKENFFKNVYIPKAAADTFKRTGKFPEKTVLVMEVYKPESEANSAKQGHFEGRFVGIEVAVKDKDAVKEGWAYYNFIGPNGEPKQTAKAFPKQACWNCHKEHGSADNTFVQFYPRLRDKD